MGAEPKQCGEQNLLLETGSVEEESVSALSSPQPKRKNCRVPSHELFGKKKKQQKEKRDIPLDDSVSRTLSIGWENASIPSTSSKHPRAYCKAFNGPSGFEMEHWKQAETQALHKLLQAAHISLSHCAYVSLSMKKVFHI